MRRPSPIVVVCFAFGEFILREGHMKVIVEVTAERRNPFEAPAHALSDRLDFRDRRPCDDHVTDIVMLQMHEDAVEVVNLERATYTGAVSVQALA